jgi:hypothetical protein
MTAFVDLLDEIDAEIDDMVVNATETALESHNEDHSSYGAGYDGGMAEHSTRRRRPWSRSVAGLSLSMG